MYNPHDGPLLSGWESRGNPDLVGPVRPVGGGYWRQSSLDHLGADILVAADCYENPDVLHNQSSGLWKLKGIQIDVPS